MSYIGYSPWQDAASYGQGLGAALGQILLQQPRLRAAQQMEQQRFPLEQQLLQAQIRGAEAAPDLKRMQLEGLLQRIQSSTALNQATEQLRKAQTELAGAAQAKDIAQTEKLGSPTQPKSPTAEQQFSMGQAAMKMLDNAAKNRALAAGMAPTVPVVVAPEVRQQVAGMAAQPNGLQQIVSLLGHLQGQPDLSTNITKGLFYDTPTVTTNRYNLSLPQAGQLAPAVSAPVSGTVRVKAPNGQTGSIPADQLQQALQSGYQLIQ